MIPDGADRDKPELPNERGSSSWQILPLRQAHRLDSAGAAPADRIEMVLVSLVSRFGNSEAERRISNITFIQRAPMAMCWHRALPAGRDC
jgi:hypothetical protein